MLRFDPVRVPANGLRPLRGIASRLLGTVFFGLFFGLGCFFVAVTAREAWLDLESRGWEERPATITRSEVSTRRGGDAYEPLVEFQYEWKGDLRTSRLLTRRSAETDAYGDAAARIAPYPVGRGVTCHVGPDGTAVLEHGNAFFVLFVLFPLIFVAIGAVGLVATWKPGRRNAMGGEAPEPISSQARPGGGSRAMVIFGAVFVLVGAGILWPTGIRPAWSIWQAREWRAETCTVERSAVRTHDGEDGPTYSVDILYRYEQAGAIHRSNRYSFFGGSSSGRSGKQAIVRAHPVGSRVTCFVDPDDPNQAVLERGPTVHAFVALLPIAFMGIGALVVVQARGRRDRRQRMMAGLVRADEDCPSPDDPVLQWLPDFTPMPGPIRLDPETSRLGRLVGIVFACLFWNGIVSVFASQALQSFERGRPEWGLTLFLVPFVLVGIVLFFALFHVALGLTNARPVLHANRDALALGDTLEIEWHLVGRIATLARLTLTLEGRESATYQRGTDSHTVTETFASIPLADVADPHRMARGRAAVAIPGDTMHSFDGGRNEIDWSLHLVGSIEGWPDIDERFPLVLLPLPAHRFEKPEEEA